MKYVKTYEQLKEFIPTNSSFFIVSKDEKYILLTKIRALELDEYGNDISHINGGQYMMMVEKITEETYDRMFGDVRMKSFYESGEDGARRFLKHGNLGKTDFANNSMGTPDIYELTTETNMGPYNKNPDDLFEANVKNTINIVRESYSEYVLGRSPYAEGSDKGDKIEPTVLRKTDFKMVEYKEGHGKFEDDYLNL